MFRPPARRSELFGNRVPGSERMEKLEARDRTANQRNEDAVGDIKSEYRRHAHSLEY